MLKISDRQIQKIIAVSKAGFVHDLQKRYHQKYSEVPEDHLNQMISSLVDLCVEADVNEARNINAIVDAHFQSSNAPFPLHGPISILRRHGFSESERVAAYIDALNGPRRRMTFEDLATEAQS